jgi:hypothetical protein
MFRCGGSLFFLLVFGGKLKSIKGGLGTRFLFCEEIAVRRFGFG